MTDLGNQVLRDLAHPPDGDPYRDALDQAHGQALAQAALAPQATADEAAAAALDWLTEQHYDPNAAVDVTGHEADTIRLAVGRLAGDGQPVTLAEWAYAAAAEHRQDRRALTEGWHDLGHLVPDANGLPTRRRRFDDIRARGLVDDPDFNAWAHRTRLFRSLPDAGTRTPAATTHGLPSPTDAMNAGIRAAAQAARRQVREVEITGPAITHHTT